VLFAEIVCFRNLLIDLHRNALLVDTLAAKLKETAAVDGTKQQRMPSKTDVNTQQRFASSVKRL